MFAGGLLIERTGGQLPSTRVLDAMRRALARGTGLTRHLLAFSRRRPVNPESIDVVAHLKGMRAMLDGSLGGHIVVEMHLAPDVWPVEVDAGEMELAILNLCLNARAALAEGGVIAITVENARAERTDGVEADFVRISIADSGHGMTPEVQARVFEPFFTTKDVSKGSGLGLPQVYGFAQQSERPGRTRERGRQRHDRHALLPRSLRSPADAAVPASAGTPAPREWTPNAAARAPRKTTGSSRLTRER